MTQGWTIDSTADTITFYEAPASGTNNIVVNEYATSSINATSIWAIGAWNGEYGFPSVVEFYSDRLVTGATMAQPHTAWFSRTGDYSMFGKSTPIADDDAFSATLNSRRLNKIVDLIPKQNLLAQTSGGVWKFSGGDSDVLSPSTISAKPQPSVGGASLRSLDVGESAIYASHKGWMVRDLSYVFEADGYAGSDLTAFAAHLLRGKAIVSWAWCPEPWSCVFAVRDDGVMLSLTYKREHQVVAWSRLETSGAFECVKTIPEDGVYGTYVCVLRNGKRYIERMADPAVGDLREDVGVDSALTYDGRNTTATTLTLSGGATPGAEVTITFSAAVLSASNVGDQVVIDYDGSPVRITITSYISSTSAKGISSRALVSSDLSPGAEWALAVDTLSGLPFSDGTVVLVGGDGFDLGEKTVSSGSISISPPAVLAHVGLPYVADFESLDMVLVGGQSVANVNKIIKAVSLCLRDSAIIAVSAVGFDKMTRLKARDTTMSMSKPVPGFTEWQSLSVPGSWRQNPRVYVRHEGPYRLKLDAIEPQVEFGK